MDPKFHSPTALEKSALQIAFLVPRRPFFSPRLTPTLQWNRSIFYRKQRVLASLSMIPYKINEERGAQHIFCFCLDSKHLHFSMNTQKLSTSLEFRKHPCSHFHPLSRIHMKTHIRIWVKIIGAHGVVQLFATHAMI
jgi:hypothetical protein